MQPRHSGSRQKWSGGQKCICWCTAQVREQLERFIGVMEQLVDSHRAAAGYAELPLRVY